MTFAFMQAAQNSTSIGNPASGTAQNMVEYVGAFTSNDDGYASTPIQLPSGMVWYYGTFNNNVNAAFTQFYVSTNGYISFGSGTGGIISSPTAGTICANPGDLWLQPGLTNTTGTAHAIWTRGGSSTSVISGSLDPDGYHYWMDIVVYCGAYGNTTSYRDWQMRLAKQGTTQYIMTRARSYPATGIPGPYGTNGTAYPGVAMDENGNSWNQCWMSTDNGVSWTYLGKGFLSMVGPKMNYLAGDGSYSISNVIDSLSFNNGSASVTLGYNPPSGFPYHTGYGGGRNLGGTAKGGASYFYGGTYVTMQAWYTTILNYVVGNFGAGDPRYTFLTDTSSGYAAGDISASGGIDLSDGIAISNVMVGNTGYTAETDTPVIRLRNLFRLASTPTYYSSLSGTYYLSGNITFNDLRPGYRIYGTDSSKIANYDNSDGTGVRSTKMYLYSSYINTSPSATSGATISLSDHIGWAKSVLLVGTGPRGGQNP